MSDCEAAVENNVDFVGVVVNEHNKDLEEAKEIIKIENFLDSLIFK